MLSLLKSGQKLIHHLLAIKRIGLQNFHPSFVYRLWVEGPASLRYTYAKDGIHPLTTNQDTDSGISALHGQFHFIP